ncbi:hypothetical protein I4U23_009449 [Adineta vaga]|nr:hypothetical protein I4U23_009449 [Adineta vaga]
MKEMINWRQLYNESQMIRPSDTSVSTERICRLVNIYKNDMIEQDLHRYAQRLSTNFRCCQICTVKSYTIYRWIDTYISGDKSLFDFRLSGQAVSPLVYYWNKTLSKQCDERGQLSDFKQNNAELIVNIRNKDIYLRFQMYYTYRKLRSLSLPIQVHNQPMKTFRYLFQTNTIAPIFVCFIDEEKNFREIFWMFRHLITIFNWPLTTKIFSNRSFQTSSIFERIMLNCLGFIDLSELDMNRKDLFCYIYRCLKTCHRNGPMIFLFDYSISFQPKSSDLYLMSFLCDLIRFDLSIPDILIIPTCLYKSYLTFSQPFLFKELVDSFIRKMKIQKQLCEIIKSQEEENIVFRFVDCIFLHLVYDANQLVKTKIDFQSVIACIELCQIPRNLSSLSSIDLIFDTLQMVLKSCPFITTDNHSWAEITLNDIQQYQLKKNSKSQLISIIRKEYFLDILAALSIVSKVQHVGTRSHVFEFEMFNQMKFLLFTFGTKQNLNIRPCLNLSQIIRQTIQLCQTRNYIQTDFIPQKAMHFRDTILSDHEWSDDDEDDDLMGDEFVEYDDDQDDIMISDVSNQVSETIKPIYRIHFQENHFQLTFFVKLIGPIIEAIVHILTFHIENQLKTFTIEEFKYPDQLHFGETSNLNLTEILSYIRRAYAYQLSEHLNIFDETPIFFQPMDDKLYPLSLDNLVLVHDDFVKLLNCCSIG